MAKDFVLKLKQILKITIPLALGIIILYFLYKGTNFNELWLYIKEANWLILTSSLIFGLLGNVIRGLRWELLINPLGYYPKRSNLIYAVLGNYAVNFALPRAGEIWRCGVINKKEKIPFKKLIGTVIIDRMFDMIMVIIIALIAFVCNVSDFFQNITKFNQNIDEINQNIEKTDWQKFLTSPYPYLAILVLLILFILSVIFLKNNFLVKKIRSFLISMWNDLLMVWKMKKKTLFIIYSFGIWTSYFLYFYITFYAFDFTSHLGIAAGLFIFTLGSISMGIPSNGGLGPWQVAIVLGLYIYMVSPEQALAFATGVFTFQSIWMVACGLFGIFALSFNKSQKNADDADNADLRR
ncbi:MAG: flippase-like domain-containing protein [Dysgonamonadaceae bacterium]|nr:flippase-like domain-containing protein [Dysgonamonadaceae bacterium]